MSRRFLINATQLILLAAVMAFATHVLTGCQTPDVGGGVAPGKGVNVSFKFCSDPTDEKWAAFNKWTFGIPKMTDALFGCPKPEAE